MIKLPKKIEETIKRELTQDYLVLKAIFIKKINKSSNVHLIAFRMGPKNRLIIMRYFGDNSYRLFYGFANMQEINEEMIYQVNKLI